VSIQPNPGATLWPAEWQGCRFTGTYIDFLGQPLAGTVTFTPSVPAVLAATSKRIAVGGPITVTLDDNGGIDVTLPATDDPQTQPVGWTYTVTEGVVSGRSYSLSAPMNTTVDLTSVVPVPTV